MRNTHVQDDPEDEEEWEERPEPEIHCLHDETQAGHCDPVAHPVKDESALSIFPAEADQEGQ